MKRVIYATRFFSLGIILIFFIGCAAENTGKSKESALAEEPEKLMRKVREIQKQMHAEKKLKERNTAFDNLKFRDGVDTVKRRMDEQTQQYDRVFGAAARLKIGEAKYSMPPLTLNER